MAPGDRELTLGELGVAISKLESAGDSRAAGYRVERQKRWALPAGCGAFGLLAVGLAGHHRRLHALIIFGYSFATTALYYAALRLAEQAGDAGRIPAVVAAWVPNLVLAAVGACLSMARRDGETMPPSGPAPPPAA